MQGGAGCPLRGAEALELGTQLVEEKRLDYLEDVLFGCVVRALGTAFILVHHRLKEGAKNRWGDF